MLKSKDFSHTFEVSELTRLRMTGIYKTIRIPLLSFSGNQNRFKSLMGNRQGQYSIRINDQWRICFEWQDDGPINVEIVDYH